MATDGGAKSAKTPMLFDTLLLPVIAEVEKETGNDARCADALANLRNDFIQIERTHPGIVHEFCVAASKKSIAKRARRNSWRLYTYSSPESCSTSERIMVTEDLKPHATALIGILERIGAKQVTDRTILLGAIKESAMALKAMLDTMERARPLDVSGRKHFDQSRKQLMRSSKLFTDGLKEYFKGGDYSKVATCTETMSQQINYLMERIDLQVL